MKDVLPVINKSRKKKKSNPTQKNYNILNHSRENVTCHTQHVIYLLSCNQCYVQYIGETTFPLHKRINDHKKGKSGSQYVVKYIKDVCIGASFSVQIIEVFPRPSPCSFISRGQNF